jgi:hypothetical protein
MFEGSWLWLQVPLISHSRFEKGRLNRFATGNGPFQTSSQYDRPLI